MHPTNRTRPARRKAALWTALLAAFCVLAMSAQAAALDGYKDRRGLYAGVKIGGGIGGARLDSNEPTGLDDNREIGLLLSGTIGGGWARNVLFGLEGNWWVRTVEMGSQRLSHQHLSFLADGDLFLLGGLYLDGGIGLAYALFDSTQGSTTREHQELGLAVKAGLGLEYFVNNTVATGLNVGYIRHIYQNADFDTLQGGITVRWY